MSENRIISFMHEVRSLDRKWRHLNVDQKRAVLDALNGEADESSVLKAIRKVKRAVCTTN
jgi:hypothetical protein